MDKKLYTLAEKPVPSAVISLAVPTIISQMIVIIYNMADTFFVGQLNDPAIVAAVSISMPAYVVLMAISNLFGIGGASLISRKLGNGEHEDVKHVASFCILMSSAAALCYAILIIFLRPYLLPVLGATEETYEYVYIYMFWTIVVGGIPTVLNPLLAHLCRGEGNSRIAGIGMSVGGIINMGLDPVFIFVFHLGIVGAAIATMLSNCIAVLFYVIYFLKNKKRSDISLKVSSAMFRNHIPREVCTVGSTSAVMSLMSMASNTIMVRSVAAYSTAAVAGLGIAKKIDMIAFAYAQGLSQGILPLIGYNKSAKNETRMKKTIQFSLSLGVISTCVVMLGLYIFAPHITQLFIQDTQTVTYGSRILRIICFVCPSTMIGMQTISVFQGMGERIRPLILSLLRKGLLDIPMMLIFNAVFGFNGLIWAVPISDWCCSIASLFMLIPCLLRLRRPGKVSV